jgi:HlyD family secretion protein
MPIRPIAVTILALAISSGFPVVPIIHTDPSGDSALIPAAHAQSMLGNLIARLRGETMPKGIVKTNGRLEATQVDVSAKYPGRLAEVSVEEGDSVTAGQVVARISSPEYEAELRAAQANVQRTMEARAAADAQIGVHQSALDFARTDYQRAQELVKTDAISRQVLDQRRRNFEAAEASARVATSQRDQALAAVKTAAAEYQKVEAVLKDLVLASPRTGRVQYQFARTGEVVSAGARILTVLDLKDVYMTIFLPASDAAKLEIGGEARIILDPVPQYVIPAKVSFVAAEAQFTPKSVETQNEREKLMFRVKLNIDPQVLEQFYKRVKTGVRGIGIVRTDQATAWPADLQVRLPQ